MQALTSDELTRMGDLEGENREVRRAVRLFRTGGAPPPTPVMLAFVDCRRAQ
jgi:hypothetical protein